MLPMDYVKSKHHFKVTT